MTTSLVVLMRWPRLGVGKSRLAAQVGVEAAHRLHCAFVADALAWPAPRPRVIAVSPDDAAVAEVRAVAPDALVVAQARGDLGHRIAGALRTALRRGVDRAVLVGTDSPSLPHRLLAQCLDHAANAGAAMVPAEDGGFVALAVHRAAARQHGLGWLRDAAIAWSTEHTAAEARAAARRSGMEITVTPPWYDVDEAGDLARLHADLVASPLRAPATLRFLDLLDVAGASRLAS
jgi:uncharacterized protein